MTSPHFDLVEFYKAPDPAPWQVFDHSVDFRFLGLICPKIEPIYHDSQNKNGNWAECSHETTGLRAIVSNIEPKNVVVNVRRDFHKSPQLHIACHFSSKRRISNFHPFLDASTLRAA